MNLVLYFLTLVFIWNCIPLCKVRISYIFYYLLDSLRMTQFWFLERHLGLDITQLAPSIQFCLPNRLYICFKVSGHRLYVCIIWKRSIVANLLWVATVYFISFHFCDNFGNLVHPRIMIDLQGKNKKFVLQQNPIYWFSATYCHSNSSLNFNKTRFLL